MIMFLSDNGWLQGEHRIPGDKFLPYEESLRVPLIIRGPGVPKGKTVKGQVSNIDFAPTLLDAAKAKAGRTMDGVSLLPTIRRPEAAGPTGPSRSRRCRRCSRPDIPINAWDRPYTGVRTDRYTYVVWTETGEHELYDRQTDPYQLQNVAGDPAYAAIEARARGEAGEAGRLQGRSCQKIKP